jgi:hypothetical protein
MIYCPSHPRCINACYVYEYTLIAEEMLGRYLKAGEIIHHKNGDQTDNRPENIEVITQSEHINLHRKDMQNDAWRKSLVITRRDAKGRIMKKGD